MTKVKICCIQSIEEAQIAIEHGAYAIGLVSEMPSGPGVIPDDKIKEIAEWSRGKINTVLLTTFRNPEEIIVQHNYCQTDFIQLVDSQKINTYKRLREEIPEVKIIQVIHVIDDDSVSQAVMVERYVDLLLLDSGNPKLEKKELGGTGRVHNWRISREIVNEVDIPVFLAGGLNPDNVAKAIDRVKPFGMDVCSGLRNDGNLDIEKLKQFIEALTDE